MGELLIPILIVSMATVVMVFPCLISRLKFRDLISRLKSPALLRVEPSPNIESSEYPDHDALNCRVQLTRQEKDGCAFDAFTVEICGSIKAPDDLHPATLQILITDITDGIPKAEPLHSHIRQWQLQDSPVFCYKTDLGRLPKQLSVISNWIIVALLDLNWLMFPRKGKRSLQFTTSILSGQTGEEFACATCIFTYENIAFGYIDSHRNIQRAKTLAIALAFTVSAADKKLFDCEIELIKSWARNNIDFSKASNKARRKLEKALNKTVVFFRDGNQLDTYKICKEIVEIAPPAQRYDILELCLRVAQASGVAAVEELALLKNLASRLEVDTERFRTMMEKILPIGIHEVKDAEVILGVTQDMTKEQTRHCLNKEYRKWNARVTSFDPEIQSQADHMLNLIAETRSQYAR